MEISHLMEKLMLILQVIVVVLVLVVLGNSATSTKLKTTRNISLTGAVSGNANFDGSGDITIPVTQSNIAVITGTVTINSSGLGNKSVTFPAGFNKDNCIVISQMYKSSSAGFANYCSGYLGLTGGSINDMLVSLGKTDGTDNNKIYIEVTADEFLATLTVDYKIVLMKI